MGVPARVAEKYTEQVLAEAVEVIVRETLRPWCETHDYLFHGRVKAEESLSEKLESGRFAKWSEIDDWYAATVVVPTAAHEEGVLQFLRGVFREEAVRSRHSTHKAPYVFRFDTTRFIGRVRDQAGLERASGVSDVRFEVQIATVFEHAWLVATHDLVYKANSMDWQRIRLAAQLKAAVEQIESLIDTFERSADAVSRSPHDETDVQAELIIRSKALIEEGLIPRTLEPLSWSRFAENVFALVRSFSSARERVDQMRTLIDRLDARARDAAREPLPMSGSLFQVILGLAHEADARSITNFVVVESGELAQFHGIATVPKAFEFD